MKSVAVVDSQVQHSEGFKIQTPRIAGNADGDQRLDFLGIHRMGTSTSRRLRKLTVTVIGAGPAGLVFARNVALHGAAVTVLEQAGDPRKGNAGYTNRSFNITLDNVGRQVLGDPRAWQGGIWLVGRAIHHNDTLGDTTYARYGRTIDAELLSIPRPVLRQNLCSLAEEAGATILFSSQVIGSDPRIGSATYMSADGTLKEVRSDLIVFGDGLHSLVSRSVSTQLGIHIWPEPRNYISGMITPEENPGLSLDHIHFWHETTNDNFTVGIPNADGSIALLIVSRFADLTTDAHPFATPALARARLRREFPRLYAIAPQLVDQLPRHRRGTFCFKTSQKYRVDDKGVIVGDAALAFPPWAGYGANQAMYGAASLADALVSHAGVIEDALNEYQRLQQILSTGLIAFVDGQGDFLSGPVVDDPAGRSEPALSMLIEAAKAELASQEEVTYRHVGATPTNRLLRA